MPPEPADPTKPPERPPATSYLDGPVPEPTLLQRVLFYPKFYVWRLFQRRHIASPGAGLWSGQGFRLYRFVLAINALYDDVAPAVGVSVELWRDYVRGTRLLPLSVARRICEKWPDVTLAWIYFGIGKPPVMRPRPPNPPAWIVD